MSYLHQQRVRTKVQYLTPIQESPLSPTFPVFPPDDNDKFVALRSAHYSDQITLVSAENDPDLNFQAWSKGDLEYCTMALARELKDLGVKPHQNVLILAPFGIDLLVTCWALIQVEAIPKPVPVNLEPNAMDERLVRPPELLNCALVVHNNELSSQVALCDSWIKEIAVKINLEASAIAPLSKLNRRSTALNPKFALEFSDARARHPTIGPGASLGPMVTPKVHGPPRPHPCFSSDEKDDLGAVVMIDAQHVPNDMTQLMNGWCNGWVVIIITTETPPQVFLDIIRQQRCRHLLLSPQVCNILQDDTKYVEPIVVEVLAGSISTCVKDRMGRCFPQGQIHELSPYF